MSLRIKFNLIIGSVLIFSLLISGLFLYRQLLQNDQQQGTEQSMQAQPGFSIDLQPGSVNEPERNKKPQKMAPLDLRSAMNSRPPAGEALLSIMLMLLTVFITIAAILNYLLHVFVIKPVRGMAVVANHVSMGRDAPEFTLDGKDEISLLAISFNRMRRSLQNAMKMLNEAQQR